MSTWTRRRMAVGVGLAGWPSVATAEVMDKETVPWSPLRLLAVVAVLGVCVLLMVWAGHIRSRLWRWAPVLVAATLAVLWGDVGTSDDWYSADVGPAMRAELPRHQAQAYAVLLPIETVAPSLAVVLLVLFLRRAQPQKGRHS
jgi:hypothetical protein